MRTEAKVCPRCGKPVTPPTAAAISWTIDVPLINNPYILRNVGLGLAVALAIFFSITGGIFGYAGGWNGVKQALLFTAGLAVFFLVVSVFTLWVVLGNRYRMEFSLDEQAIIIASRSSRAHTAHRLALILGMLARNPAAVAAGAGAVSGETVSLAWKNARGFTAHPEKQTIIIKRKFLPSLYIFCLPQNYAAAAQYVSDKINRAQG